MHSTQYDELSDERQNGINALLDTLYNTETDCDDVRNEDQQFGVDYSFRQRVAGNSDVSIYTINMVIKENEEAIKERLEQRERLSAFTGQWGCHPGHVFDTIPEPDKEEAGVVEETRKHTTKEQYSQEHVRSGPHSLTETYDKPMKRVTVLLVAAVVAIAIALRRIANRDNE